MLYDCRTQDKVFILADYNTLKYFYIVIDVSYEPNYTVCHQVK